MKQLTQSAIELIDNFCARHNLNGESEHIKDICYQIINNADRYIKFNNVTAQRIKDAACDYYDLEEKLIYKSTREIEIVHVRQVIQYLLRDQLRIPYKRIGQLTGGKDHATVYHARNKIKDCIEKPLTPYHRTLAEDIENIKQKL